MVTPEQMVAFGKVSQKIKYGEMFRAAAADLEDANERFRQARMDSIDAAFRGLVFGCAAVGVHQIKLEPSDQGDYMSIVWLLDENGDDHPEFDALSEELWNYASDLTDHDDAGWRILTGVRVAETGYTVEIDVDDAAKALAA